MDLNLNSFFYLFFRLAPFIIACFFTIGSLLNSDLKGFVYLIGLIFTCCLTIPIISAFGNGPREDAAQICKTFKINGFHFTETPISLVIFGYTLFYLVYPIAKYDLAMDNIILLIFFPVLIATDLYWNISKQCYHTLNCIIALLIGGSIGCFWGYLIDKTNLGGLQYFNIGSNREKCNRASKQRFVCTTYKNGKVVEYASTEK